ncbi:diaminopimelate decarboxylase [Georgenia sp. Z1491]|uniref:diaminopimelate decarboxylase n=1 Tax=Georgenia sp. Z1491 TaxID=3416707 RepID=UPI003CF9D5B5
MSDHGTELATLAAPEPDGSAAGPWSTTTRRDEAGGLEVGGVALTDLAREHGTPAYVLDLADLRGRAQAWADAFARHFAPGRGLAGADVYYAGKALLTVGVARIVHAAGLRVDTSTGGELATALRAGVPGPSIGLHGNNKSDAEIAAAIDAGVGRIVVDSLAEIDRVTMIAAERGTSAPVMVRVTTGVHAGGHEFIATAHEDQKFGLSLASGAAREAVGKILAEPALELVGLHSHIGSQILDLAGFEAAARAVLALREDVRAATGRVLPEVDLGGGYGIRYTGADAAGPTPDDVAATLAAVVATECARIGSPVPRVSVEPGRSVVGPAGLTLYRVGTIKDVALDDGASRRYVSVDGGMSDHIRTALYGADYTAALASRPGDGGSVATRVVGKHCESGDIVVRDVALPAGTARGDLLAVPVTGAYGRSMSSQYNLVPRPPVIGVEDGRARVMVRRETIEDLLALDED